MSGDLLTLAWQVGGLKPSEKLTLLFTADLARDEHGRRVWCKACIISAATSLSQQSVKDALRSLVEQGHLSRQVRPGTTTIYTVHPRPTGGEILPQAEIYPGSNLPPPEGKIYPGGGGKIYPGVGVQITPLTTIEPSIEPSGELPTRSRAPAPVVPDWIPADAWNGFVEMRRKARAALTDRAVELSISKLADLRDAGNEPGAVLDQSTSHGWKGLFPLKEINNGNRSGTPQPGGFDAPQNPIMRAVLARRARAAGNT